MAKRRLTFLLRALVVALLALVCVAGANAVLTQKSFSDSDNTTASFENFYKLEEDSVDVLFLGTSHTREGIVPQALYDEYGITSYNLASSSQATLLSYYWLQEALKTQDPQVVVLDVLNLFGEGIGCDEGQTRKALDYMRWSSTKIEAIQDVCALDETQTELSYYLPNVRYHDRWKELSEADFSSGKLVAGGDFHGYASMYAYGTTDEDFSPLVEGASDEADEMGEVKKEYLDRIVELCEQEDIELVFLMTPSAKQTIEQHNAVAAYAEEHGIDYYDLNEQELYEELGYDFNEDNVDEQHANLSGALKITSFMGELLSEDYGLASHESEGWEESRQDYEEMCSDYWLGAVEDLDEYLDELAENEDRYSIFLMAQGDAFSGLDESQLQALEELGLSIDWASAEGAACVAVIEEGEVALEELGSADEALESTGSIDGGRTLYTIASAGSGAGGSCSLLIEGTETAVQGEGLDIVVYDSERERVVDAVCFGAGEDGLVASR